MSEFVPKSAPLLPQQLGSFSRWNRGFWLWWERRHYKYNYSHVPDVAVLDKLHFSDDFSRGWIAAIGQRLLEGIENRTELEESDDAKQYHINKHRSLRHVIHDIFQPIEEAIRRVRESLRLDARLTALKSSAKSLEDLRNMFRKIGLPPIYSDFASDRFFANTTVSGANPVMIKRLTVMHPSLPVDAAMFQRAIQFNLPGWHDSLDAALAEGRLFLVDHAALDGAEMGTMPNGQKYLYAPLALFVLSGPTRELLPVAIRCKQKPAADNPIILPEHGYNWMIAKTIVQTADANIHEASTHLARTHLVMEAFVIASYRQLADHHPLSILLWPHFEGTLAINDAAWKHLVSDGGAIDKLLGGTIHASRAVVAKSMSDLNLMNDRLPKCMERRGVNDPQVLPYYPYRDDAMQYWQAIHQWAEDYIRLYYFQDADVLNDRELQAWGRELVSRTGGRLNGLPNDGQLQTVNELIDVVGFVLYTCSVQHAAVNFPQYYCMSYVPNMPLAGYRPAPTSATGATEADYLNMLPTMDMAELQMEVCFLLGSVHYTTLGEYEPHHFRDSRVAAPLKLFQARLKVVGEHIAERNQLCKYPYETLVPAGIPQSINI